jgi:hypothetical protein
MSIALNSRLFVLAGLLLPIFPAHANLNRGDSPLREIPPGKFTSLQANVSRAGDVFASWSAANRPTMGHDKSGDEARETDDLAMNEEFAGDEPYFGSATWSKASRPRMVDFSFGQPCSPLLWWEAPDTGSSVDALAKYAGSIPETTFEWGDLRKPSNPSHGDAATNAGMALLPFSLLGMLGLVFRRGN